jgi:hypothetical protein
VALTLVTNIITKNGFNMPSYRQQGDIVRLKG